MGDFNVDLLNYFADTSTTQFLDQMYSSSLLSQITSPTYISTKSKTLMGNSMSNHPIFLDVDTLTSQILFKDQSLKISTLNCLWSGSYWDLTIWPKWVFQGKICHFEFTFSVITIFLVILSFWNLVWVSFLEWEIQNHT